MRYVAFIFFLSILPSSGIGQLHKLLKEIGEGSDSGLPNYNAHAFWQDKMFFLGNWIEGGYTIWSTDGTTENTLLLTSDYRPGNLISLKNYLLFDSDESGNQVAGLYRMNSPAADIELVKSFPNSSVRLLTTLNDSLLLLYRVPYGFPNDSLWVSDGTPEGTIVLGAYEIVTLWMQITKYEDQAVFSENSSNDDEYKFRPIISDGTPEGTMLVSEYLNNPEISMAVGSTNHLFCKTNSEGDSGIVFNGHTTSAILLPGALYNAFSIGDLHLVFTQTSLVAYDAAGDTSYLLPVTPRYNEGYVWTEPILFNGKVYFHGADEYVYVTDGTSAGTRQLAASTTAGRDPYLFGFNNTLFYTATDENKVVIRALNLETNIDTMFSTVKPGIFSTGVSSYIHNLGERLVYKTYSNAEGREWFVYDPFLISSTPVLSHTDVKLFPNPANHVLFFQQSTDPVNGILYLLDHVGHVLSAEPISEELHKIDIQPLTHGLYFTHFRSASGISIFGSFLKQ